MALQVVEITTPLGTMLVLTNQLSGTVQGATQTVQQQLLGLQDGATLGNIASVVAKNTQAAFGLGVQDYKDSGRNLTTYQMVLPAATSATDTLQSLTGYKGGAAVTATTTPAAVTSGKTFRIQSISLTYIATSTAGLARFTLRALSAGGTVSASSPAVWTGLVGSAAATAGISNTANFDIPDGLELPSGSTFGVSMAGVGSTGSLAAVGYGQISLVGYEY